MSVVVDDDVVIAFVLLDAAAAVGVAIAHVRLVAAHTAPVVAAVVVVGATWWHASLVVAIHVVDHY